MSNQLTAERLRELLEYDPETGVFRWLVRTSNRIKVGQIAGCISNGYRVIRVDGSMFLAHRLACLYMTGKWPADQIDHRNVVRPDIRWSNLREASSQQNSANRGALRNNKSGLKGAIFEKRSGRWISKIVISGRLTYLGSFDTPEEAHKTYMAAAVRHYGEFARAA
jgi:hypothetical protein